MGSKYVIHVGWNSTTFVRAVSRRRYPTAGLVKDVQNLVVLPWAVRVSDGGLLTCFGQVMRGLKNVAQHFGGGGGA